MAGIGREEYPELTLSKTVEIVEAIGRQNVKTSAGLAQVMGLKSVDSGYFYHQVSALTKYFGVVNRTKESLSLTPLGQRIAHPLGDVDRRMALAEAAGRVSLLHALYESLGQNFHEADFRAKLRDITGATPAEIEKAAPFIEKLYRDAIPYIAQITPTRPGTAVEAAMRGELAPTLVVGSATPGAPRISAAESGYRVFESDGVYLKVKKDRDALEEADAVIRAWLGRLDDGPTRSEKPSKGRTKPDSESPIS